MSRFTQTDTVIPGAANPQAFNRYSYALNQPTSLTDPSGHMSCNVTVNGSGPISEEDCYGAADGSGDAINYGGNSTAKSVQTVPADPTSNDDEGVVLQLPCSSISGVAGAVYGTTCGNLNQAAQILYNPNATIGQKIGAGYYINVVGWSHAAVVFGLVWAAWEAIIPTSMACATNPACEQEVSSVSYNSFRALKAVIGNPGTGNVWHHIVEQSQIIKSGFSPQQINSLNNIIPVSQTIHRQISGFYSSSIAGPGTELVRDWLAGQSFAAQYEFGIQVLQKFGAIP